MARQDPIVLRDSRPGPKTADNALPRTRQMNPLPPPQGGLTSQGTIKVSEPSISFIVPCRNGEPSIRQCLQSLQDLRRNGDEIIVVDNGSTDETFRIAAAAEDIVVFESDATTVAGVRNDGARRARGDWLAFVDCDTVLAKDWRTHLERVFRHNAVVATGSGPHLPPNPRWLEKAWLCGWGDRSGPAEYVWSGNLIVRAEAFQTLNGFSEDLETDEDTDFCWRVREIFGEQALVHAPQMKAVHLGNSKTLKQFWSRQYWHAAGMLASARKHGLDKALAMTTAFAFLNLFGLGWFLSSPNPLGGITLAGSILLVPGLTALYRMRALECIRWGPQLVLLYTLFYYARLARASRDSVVRLLRLQEIRGR